MLWAAVQGSYHPLLTEPGKDRSGDRLQITELGNAHFPGLYLAEEAIAIPGVGLALVDDTFARTNDALAAVDGALRNTGTNIAPAQMRARPTRIASCSRRWCSST